MTYVSSENGVWHIKHNEKGSFVKTPVTPKADVKDVWYLSAGRRSIFFADREGLYRIFTESNEIVPIQTCEKVDRIMGVKYYKGELYFSAENSISKICFD